VTFKPKFITQKNWMIQAQYFWMHKNSTGYAECGTLINVTAGDVIETKISFAPETGAMHASIGVKGGTPEQLSSIISKRPFPNEHPPLWDTWGDFFKAGEAKSKDTVGPGVLNHADFNIGSSFLRFFLALFCAVGVFRGTVLIFDRPFWTETHGVPPDVLCDICPFALTKAA